jgi:ATP-dependent DNA ligase
VAALPAWLAGKRALELPNDALHSRRFDDVAMLYAFDLLELDGEDLRSRPLAERKAMLKQLLRRAFAGIAYRASDTAGALLMMR